MNSPNTLLAIAVVLLTAAPVWAGKVPESPAELRANAQAIVTGRVKAYQTEDVTDSDGSKTRYVDLEVVIESVDKGGDLLKGGETASVRCWPVVREPLVGTLWDAGDDYIPPPEARAVFYLRQRSKLGWSPIYPNGVAALDDSRSLAFPRESVWLGLLSWPYVLLPGGALLALVVAPLAIAKLRRRRAAV